MVPAITVSLIVATTRADPPKSTVAPAWKPDPLTVTDVPPPLPPLLGVTEVTEGAAAAKLKQEVHEPLCASGLVTTTFTAPAVCAVVVPVMVVALIVATVSADPPNETEAPATKSLPVIVTDVPPAAAPLFGTTEVTAGGGAGATYVKQPVHVPVCASGFVTTALTIPAA